MSLVYFCSDLHIGHENILRFSKETRVFPNIAAHDKYIRDEWCNTVKKRDTVFVGGDLGAWKGSPEAVLDFYSNLPGRKILIRGNHDPLNAKEYLKVFDDVQAFFKYKGYWISHCPMHPNELWGCVNIHGHVHSNTIRLPDGSIDRRYVNLCMENRANLGGHTIVPFTLIQELYPSKRQQNI